MLSYDADRVLCEWSNENGLKYLKTLFNSIIVKHIVQSDSLLVHKSCIVGI